MQIGGALNLEIQFSDFTENEKYYSLVDLGTKPSFVSLSSLARFEVILV